MMKLDLRRTSVFPVFASIIVFVIFVVLGLALLPSIPVQLNPGLNTKSIVIRTYNDRISTAELEEQVTSVIEGAVSVVNGIKNVHSQSNGTTGLVTVDFDKYVDMETKRYEILSVLRRIFPSLPQHTGFPSITVNQHTGNNQDGTPLLIYNIASDTDIPSLASLIEESIVKEISALQEVSEVQLYGNYPDVCEITFDNAKLQLLGIGLNQVTAAIQNTQGRIFVGKDQDTDKEGRVKAIVIENEAGKSLNISDIPVVNQNGKIIQVGDFATVKTKKETPLSYYRINGKNTLGLGIFPKEGINQLKFSRKIKNELSSLRENLPEGVQLFLIRDNTDFIRQEVNKLLFCSCMTLIILVLFIYLVSRDTIYMAVILLSFFSTLSIAFFLYYLFGIELHLFSFAGLAISFGMLLDDSIMMLEHLKRNRNKSIFMSIFASSLTTVAAMSAVFFLDEETRLHLGDFARVVIVNLTLSSLSSLFLVPALFDVLKPKSRFTHTLPVKRIRRVHFISRLYQNIIFKLVRIKAAVFILAILSFGIPTFLLPEKMEGTGKWSRMYNQTVGSSYYKYTLRKTTDKVFGGALRWFTEKVEHQNYNAEREETRVMVNAILPQGTKLGQTNRLFEILEEYMGRFREVKMFQTFIPSDENGAMNIYFTKEAEDSGFPSVFVNILSRFTLQLGSAEWNISGAGESFNNDMREQTGSNKLFLYGYNYEALKKYADEIKTSLERNLRVDGVSISSQNRMFRSTVYEHTLTIGHEKLAYNEMPVYSFLPGLVTATVDRRQLNPILQGNILTDVYLTSEQKDYFDLWKMENNMFFVNRNAQKLVNYGDIRKKMVADGIYKTNQQYQLVIDYDYIGDEREGRRFLEMVARTFDRRATLGFSVRTMPQFDRSFHNGQKNQSKEWFLLYLLIAIYFICAILLESFTKPLAVIAMVPFSFIGVFVSFALFHVDFDQGGYASLFLLAGLTVNATIYIIVERNFIITSTWVRRTIPSCFTYFRAFDNKIIPILLTIFSTSLGLIPFLILGRSESFWYPLAVGAIGGLSFSLIGILFVLPLFLIHKKDIVNKF